MNFAALCTRRGGGVLAAALLALAAAAALTGCVLPAREPLGATRTDVIARLGQPTSVWRLPSGGERLLYSELPAGFAAYNLDFDASGQLVHNEQVLTQTRFESLPLGQATRDELLRTFGQPLLVERVARFDGDIWTYRFRQLSDLRRAHVHLDPQGIVRQVLFTDESADIDDARN